MTSDCIYKRICELFNPESCDRESSIYCGLYLRREEARIAELEAGLECDGIAACDIQTAKRYVPHFLGLVNNETIKEFNL